MMHTVIGGGIAGTILAMLLARQKDVTVIDRLSEETIRSSGAGFVLWPNGVKIFRSLFPTWNLDEIGTDLTGVKTYKKNGDLFTSKDLQSTFEQSGCYPIVINRAALMDKLYNYIQKKKMPVSYVFGRHVNYQSLLADSNGSSVFLCSGINSGVQGYGVTASYAKVYNFVGVSPTFLPHITIGHEYLGDQVRAGYMPLLGDRLYFRYSFFQPYKTHFSDPQKKLLTKFSRFPTCVREHIESLNNKEISVRPEMSAKALPPLSNIDVDACLPILGDALCPMTSGSGQGVSQALEDAYIAYLLLNEKGLTPTMLRDYYAERLPRREMIREASLKVTQMMSLPEEEFIDTWGKQALRKNSYPNNPILTLPTKITEAIKCGTISFY